MLEMKLTVLVYSFLLFYFVESTPERSRISVRGFGAPGSLAGDEDTIQGETKGNVTCAMYSEFACANRETCISALEECDKVKDCTDGSDEHKNCEYFDCMDGTYIKTEFLCDEFEDCSNAYDEDREHGNCSVVHCTGSTIAYVRGDNICDGFSDCQDEFNSDECNCSFTFVCDNKKCIHGERKCDGDDNCGDGSDERHCQMFNCGNGNRILSSRLCDGFDDCADSSDECGCIDTFNCTNGRCILEHLVCDGVDACGDSSDECPCQNSFHCRNGKCIQAIYVGDGFDHCGDDSDEIIPTTLPTPDVTSAPAQFKCQHGMDIDLTLKCNGFDDCKDGKASDECDCAWTTKCDAIDGKCVNNSVCDEWTELKTSECNKSGGHLCSHLCIAKNDLCNGLLDCPDGSDEDCLKCDGNKLEHHSKLCDGTIDCYDKSDECECNNQTFRCANGKCIDRSDMCTGEDVCGDCSAEENCPVPETKPTQLHEVFRCDDGHCFRADERCVGEAKCAGKEDLVGCKNSTKDDKPQLDDSNNELFTKAHMNATKHITSTTTTTTTSASISLRISHLLALFYPILSVLAVTF